MIAKRAFFMIYVFFPCLDLMLFFFFSTFIVFNFSVQIELISFSHWNKAGGYLWKSEQSFSVWGWKRKAWWEGLVWVDGFVCVCVCVFLINTTANVGWGFGDVGPIHTTSTIQCLMRLEEYLDELAELWSQRLKQKKVLCAYLAKGFSVTNISAVMHLFGRGLSLWFLVWVPAFSWNRSFTLSRSVLFVLIFLRSKQAINTKITCFSIIVKCQGKRHSWQARGLLFLFVVFLANFCRFIPTTVDLFSPFFPFSFNFCPLCYVCVSWGMRST